MTTFVALDLETTGLTPGRDRIIEVGAARFTPHGEEASFSSLVNPGIRPSRFIEGLTGIRADDLATAPKFEDVRADLARFLDGHPIVGHNIEFDLQFLRSEGLEHRGPVIDTAALARAVLPHLKSHRLDDLARELGIAAGGQHRALSDARVAAQVFLALLRMVESLDPVQREPLLRHLGVASPVLEPVLAGFSEPGVRMDEETAQDPRDGAESVASHPHIPVPLPFQPLAPLEPVAAPIAIRSSEIRRVFRAMEKALPGYAERPEQLHMAESVGESFARGAHLLVEAGTGVGKSLAYLVPAALDAVQNGRRVVVSTNTIALQEQLLKKDVPVLRNAMAAAGVIPSPDALRVTVLKGRANYLCYARWVASFITGVRDPDVARLSAMVMRWLETTATGDRAELRLAPDESAAWLRVSAADAQCLARQVRQVREGNCFLWRARKAAESAHIIIVNHALLLADVAREGNVLPPFEHLIIDEAHNLEGVATDQFGASLALRSLTDALTAIHRPRTRDQREGGAAMLLKVFDGDAYVEAARKLEAAVESAGGAGQAFFAALSGIPGGSGAGDAVRVLVDRAVRHSPAWERVEDAWALLATELERVEAAGGTGVRLVGSAPVEGAGELADELASAIRRVNELRMLGNTLLGPPDADWVTWVEQAEDGRSSLHRAPIRVAELLREHLFDRCRVVVATSATLSAGDDMSFAAERLGLESAGTLRLGSPFDYRRVALLATAADMPDPKFAAEFERALPGAVAQLVAASGGRALVLFTSNALLARVAQRLRPLLDPLGISVLAQGIDGPPARLIDQLKQDHATVILGSASFWEGVDIRGEALSLLVVTRLPFAPPDDPVEQARQQLYDNPFNEYSVPSAILRFRQGFGRLIRDHADRGAVVVLDPRVWAKSYGRRFLDALPPCRHIHGPIDVLADAVEDWLAR